MPGNVERVQKVVTQQLVTILLEFSSRHRAPRQSLQDLAGKVCFWNVYSLTPPSGKNTSKLLPPRLTFHQWLRRASPLFPGLGAKCVPKTWETPCLLRRPIERDAVVR